ncbi:hypothetical protein [Bacillus sp. 1P06AnD]|uniref:hypothetical protein n=1 Tax=Bacillus sp. 1P06AnD TaxID=3132208 RepID=UPI0039A382FA
MKKFMITGMAAVGLLAATGTAFAFNPSDQETSNNLEVKYNATVSAEDTTGKKYEIPFNEKTMQVDSIEDSKIVKQDSGKKYEVPFNEKTMQVDSIQ